MRVIKSGREKEWTVTCPCCAADLVYKTEDVRKEQRAPLFRSVMSTEPNRYFREEKQDVSVVVCPECGEHVIVPDRAQARKLFLVDGGDWV